MADISQKTFFKKQFLEWKCLFIDWKYTGVCVPEDPTNNKSALVNVRAQCWTDKKSLSAAMMTQLTDSHMHHEVSVI